MIYFDTAYIVKCYLPEAGCDQVRALLYQQQTVACCAWGRLEFITAIRRAIREGRLPEAAQPTILSVLSADEQNGVWSWLPLTPHLLETAVQTMLALPVGTIIRAADALHLVCARENGYQKIYTNDRHMLSAASQFGIEAINVIPLD